MRNVEESAIAREAERRDDFRHEIDHLRSALMKVEPLLYGDRKVYSVAGFNRGVADWLARLPTLWIEGEVTELRRNDRWGSVFFTLKDPEDGACLPASIPRRTFDALKLDLAEGERIHVLGRPELYAAKGEFRLRALSLERFGLGAHLAAIERLKQALAAEGVFDAARKRPLPRFPRRIGLVTGSDAAARHDVITTIQTRFPPARVARRRDARPGAARRRRRSSRRSRRSAASPDRRRHPHARRRQLRRPAPVQRRERRPRRRGLPGPDRLGSRTRAGHAALRPRRGCARLDPDGGGQARRSGSRGPSRGVDARRRLARTLRAALDRTRARRARTRTRSALERGTRRALDRDAQRLSLLRDRLRRGPALLVERRRAPLERAAGRLAALSPRATLGRGYAIVRAGDSMLRTTAGLAPGDASTSSWRKARSAPASRTCAMSELTFESAAAGARADRRAARARQRRPRRGDQALGARRRAAALLPRAARGRGGQDRRARPARGRCGTASARGRRRLRSRRGPPLH